MREIYIVIFVFVWIFTVALCFIAFNTLLIGKIFPVFHDVAGNMSYTDMNAFDQKSNLYKNVFYAVFFILFALPFVFLLVRLMLKREPQPYSQGGGYVNGVNV